MAKAKKIDLFLSHNSADKPWTERLASAVEADRTGPRLKVFFDKWDIQHGADIPLELEQGLQNSRYVGLVLSPEALASDWVVLERSTAIFRDPAARKRGLIPLMRRKCELPDMLARLRYLDFRRDQDFEEGLRTLIGILRGVPLTRGAEISEADVHFREDADLLRYHRQIFQRPAFSVSCVDELFLSELSDAIDGATAALNTGSLYSRSNNLLASFDASANYRVPEFKEAFRRIGEGLTTLKREAVELIEFFGRVCPDSSRPRYFLEMAMSSANRHPQHLATIIQRMDKVDRSRNNILQELNPLLAKCGLEPFNLITLSSAKINEGRQFGAFNQIAKSLNTARDVPDGSEFPRGRKTAKMAGPEVSIISSLCLAARERIERGEVNPNHHYEELIMRSLKPDIYSGMRHDPLAKTYLESALRDLPTESPTMGPRGEEIQYFGVRTFPSGDSVGLFGVWPAHGTDLYAIVLDEKFPEYFGLFFRSCSNPDQAENEWHGLARFERMRNEELGKALAQNGWRQLVPQVKG